MESSNKRLIFIGLGIALVLAAIFVVPRLAASYYYERGRSLYLRDNAGGAYFEEAKANLNRSLLFNSKNPAPYVYLGRIALGKTDSEGDQYYPDADWAAALPYYQKALGFGIKEADALLYAHVLENLGQAYFYSGRYDEAKSVFMRKINEFPDSFFNDPIWRSTFWSRLLVAEMDFERFNKPQEAEELLLPVANFVNADPRGLYRVNLLLSRLYSYVEDWEQAEKYANFVPANIPAGTEDSEAVQVAHSILAVVAGSKKDFATAEREAVKARDFGAPAAGDCVLANAYFSGGAYQRALGVINKVERPGPFSYRYSICLAYGAEAAKALGNKAEAKRLFEEYLSYTDALDPKNIFVMRFREKFSDELKKID